ncbi:MAG: 50S ribosomal protein L23 [Candidatus Thermoplasmatota archaeon]|nr:50S ribosomal protein L23 [Candidatus Thermoplasmatota archaeon]MBU1941254.1 50S ribosomal protein L23 [Candidatus Thermoplasmatota archaeon]
MDPYNVVLHPFVTEKTMNQMEQNNALEFIVHRTSTKNQIKQAVEQMFDVKVKKVNTKIMKNGKHAIVVFMPDFKAEDLGMRIGVF